MGEMEGVYCVCVCMAKVDDASFAWKFLAEYSEELWIAMAY